MKFALLLTRWLLCLFIALPCASAQEGWHRTDLSDDPAALSVLMALLRNHERFAQWIGDRPLHDDVVISLRKDRINPSKVVYTLVEFDADHQPKRFLRLDEITRLEVREGEPLEKAELIFDYPAAAVGEAGLTHPSVQRAIEQIRTLRASAGTLYLINNQYVPTAKEGDSVTSTLVRLSPGGTALVRLLSAHAKQVNATVKAMEDKGEFVWDPTSRKRVRFELSADGRQVRQVEVHGLFKGRNVELHSPDATSVAPLRLDEGTPTAPLPTHSPPPEETAPAKSALRWDTKD